MNVAKEWTIYRTRFLVRACQLTEPFAFTDALGREHSGQPGDYLVESSEGCFRITSRDIFEDIYVPLSSGHPHENHEKRALLDRALRALGPWTARPAQPGISPPGACGTNAPSGRPAAHV